MTKPFDSHKPATVFDHDSTLVVALELSGKRWDLGAVVPGVTRRPHRSVEVRDVAAVLASLAGWRAEAGRAGRTVRRVVLTYEAGRDGFWIARALQDQGIEVHVMHAASIPVERTGRRAKTDRIDVMMLLRTLLAWLRGEPAVCSMVRIPTQAEEDLREPGREREALMRDRVAIENQMGSLLCRHGVVAFKPRLKKAAKQLEQLRDHAGAPLPPHTQSRLRRLMMRQCELTQQIEQIDAERERVRAVSAADRFERMIQNLVRIFGLGLETATQLVREVFCRPFRDRRALAAFVGLAGTPFRSGGMEREQGISKNGNPRVRRVLMQLAWRWVRWQPASALSCWFHQRTAGAKGRIRKIMIVALARKLLVALWRYAETGVLPDGARLGAA